MHKLYMKIEYFKVEEKDDKFTTESFWENWLGRSFKSFRQNAAFTFYY